MQRQTSAQKPKVEVRTVSMYPSEWSAVEAFSQTKGYGSTSAALRRIVNEWKQYRNYQLDVPAQELEPA